VTSYARRLRRRRSHFGDTWYLNQVFLKINGAQACLWRAADQDGEVVNRGMKSSQNGWARCTLYPCCQEDLNVIVYRPMVLDQDSLGTWIPIHLQHCLTAKQAKRVAAMAASGMADYGYDKVAYLGRITGINHYGPTLSRWQTGRNPSAHEF
jgi:hypothetical protein